MVHVDDVAIAHIFLLEHPDLKGRYICSPLEVTIHQISEFLSVKYPEYPVPRAEYVPTFLLISSFLSNIWRKLNTNTACFCSALKGIEESKSRGLSSKKLVDSGFEFKYGFEEMFDGAIQCCKERGLI